jgi:hypothetical protein
MCPERDEMFSGSLLIIEVDEEQVEHIPFIRLQE